MSRELPKHIKIKNIYYKIQAIATVFLFTNKTRIHHRIFYGFTIGYFTDTTHGIYVNIDIAEAEGDCGEGIMLNIVH